MVTLGLVLDKSCLKECASHRKEVTITENLLEKKTFIFSSQPVKLQAQFRGKIMYILTLGGRALTFYRNTNIVRLS